MTSWISPDVLILHQRLCATIPPLVVFLIRTVDGAVVMVSILEDVGSSRSGFAWRNRPMVSRMLFIMQPRCGNPVRRAKRDLLVLSIDSARCDAHSPQSTRTDGKGSFEYSGL